MSDFKPVLRFIASSDIHYNREDPSRLQNYEKGLALAYEYAASQDYNKIDALYVVGDFADNGSEEQFNDFRKTLDTCIKPETKWMLTMASHEYFSDDGEEGALKRLKEIMKQEPDNHIVINGFHFIGISVSATDGDHYSDYQREWLVEQLNEAVKDDPLKPIFVMHHEHVANTVYGSSDFEGWGTDYFADIFKRYPQVVHFSGHSHYPINDPRSIWQGEYTALGTGGLYYVELTVDDERTVHPDGHKKVASFWVVEVDANNRMRFRAVDLTAEEYLVEYNLAGPFDRKYTTILQMLRSEAPEFKEGTTLAVKGKKVTFAAAESMDGMPIFIYRAYAVDSEGNRTPVGKTLAEYYNYEVPDTVTITLENLPDGDYTLEVVAENCYGMQSAPIK